MTEDRISYSYGFTVPGDEAYSSRRVDISISTDLRPGETPQQALDRARGFVLSECDRELGQLRRGAPVQAPAAAAPAQPRSRVEDEAFDPNNSNHMNIARMVFDTQGVKSEKARAYKCEHVLKGRRVGDLGEIVRKDEELFKVKRIDGSRSNWNGQWNNRR